MRGEKPDEAQPLFVEAALRFESAERFVNAGNGWFFAGENGRALANYRAAERRSPFDRQLRDSIEFLRANRADAFPPPAAPSGRLAASLDPVLHLGAVLRVGLFVVAYLVAWTVFLAAQLAGWRVRRAVWAVLAVAVMRAVGIGGPIQFPARGRDCHRGHGRATRPWLRLRPRLRATSAQGRRVFVAGDPSRLGAGPVARRLGGLAAGIRLYASGVTHDWFGTPAWHKP